MLRVSSEERIAIERVTNDEQLEEGTPLDGYGDSFSPEAQERHLQFILEHINNLKEDIIYSPQAEWKDKPAGHHEKGSGV